MESSKRTGSERRRLVAEVRRLQTSAAWNPAARSNQQSIDERVGELAQADRAERTYEAAEICVACERARDRTGDGSALCERHLAEAMGVPWDGKPV